ncbi:MAG: hypothetical protein PQJ50_12835 [Spirochaetales bacterium]|nr:hypothetical protein [Spirochaetales bacterium]
MGVEAVNEEQKTIIEYVKNHFVDWMEEKNIYPFPRERQSIDTQLLERIVRVEETLKRQNDKFDHQNEKFELLITSQEKRFTALETQMNQRFNRQNLYHLATFTAVIGSAVAVILKA